MSVKSAIKNLIELERSLVDGMRELNGQEARALVDLYYQMQDNRKAAANQIRALGEEPHTVLPVVVKWAELLEDLIKNRLEPYVLASAPGRWMMAQPGIGPVLAANMLAHLDVTKTATAGGFWRFAGLDPTLKWKKGQKRPFNARLKTACWKLEDSWVKLGDRHDSLYARVYRERKALEVERNDLGTFADQAAAKIEQFNIGKGTEAYKAYSAGKLPPRHIDQRARRYAVKLFLAHLHWVMYEDHYKKTPPKPYVVEHLGHAHIIAPPGWATEVSRAA